MKKRANKKTGLNQPRQSCRQAGAAGYVRLPRKATGFTLVELIVTVAIASILAMVGMPSLQKTVQDNRMTTLYNNFLADLNYTRNAAITFGSPVTVCKRNTAGNGCDANSTDWGQGWLVFHDKDNDGVVDSGEKILLDNNTTSKIAMIFSGNPNRITYNAQGFARGYAGKITFCDERGNDARKGMVISQNGRIRMADSHDTLSSCTSGGN